MVSFLALAGGISLFPKIIFTKGKRKYYMKCLFCKTLKNIRKINNKYVCSECNNKITLIMKHENKKRTSAEGILAHLNKKIRTKEKKEKKQQGKINQKDEYIDYKSYLKTKHWETTKKRYYKSKLYDGKCKVCGVRKKFHIHHKTYERFKNERLTDLVHVCPECHKIIHEIVSFIRQNKVKTKVSLNNCHTILRNQLKKSKSTKNKKQAKEDLLISLNNKKRVR